MKSLKESSSALEKAAGSLYELSEKGTFDPGELREMAEEILNVRREIRETIRGARRDLAEALQHIRDLDKEGS